MSEPAYPAARAVADQVRLHFSRQLAEERERGTRDLASEPDNRAIEAVLDAAFWASLLRQEHYPPKFSLALLAPEQSRLPLTFEQRLPLQLRGARRAQGVIKSGAGSGPADAPACEVQLRSAIARPSETWARESVHPLLISHHF